MGTNETTSRYNCFRIYKRLNINIQPEKHIRPKAKPPVFSTKTGGFGPSGETRLHFLPGGKKIEVLPPSSRRQATVHRTVAFDLSSLSTKRNKQKRHKAISAYLVRVARLELAASWSQTRRPTNWATPGNLIAALSKVVPYSRLRRH